MVFNLKRSMIDSRRVESSGLQVTVAVLYERYRKLLKSI